MGRSLSTAVLPPDPFFLHVAHRCVPHGYPPSLPPAPREPVSLLHANSIREAWSSRGIPYYDTGGLKKETKNADGRVCEGRRRKRKVSERRVKRQIRAWQRRNRERREMARDDMFCLETEVYLSLATSLKRGIINIRSFLQIVQDMQDMSAWRVEDIASDI